MVFLQLSLNCFSFKICWQYIPAWCFVPHDQSNKSKEHRGSALYSFAMRVHRGRIAISLFCKIFSFFPSSVYTQLRCLVYKYLFNDFPRSLYSCRYNTIGLLTSEHQRIEKHSTLNIKSLWAYSTCTRWYERPTTRFVTPPISRICIHCVLTQLLLCT